MNKILVFILCLTISSTFCLASNSKNQNDKYKNMNKPTSQMTSKEIKQRDLLFKACVNSGENRAKCYAMYY